MRSFEEDTHPGRPRILFIGHGESTHTHAWIDLLKDSDFNVRLFSLPTGVPPDSWWAKTYVTTYGKPESDSSTRLGLFNKGRPRRLVARSIAHLRNRAWAPEEQVLSRLAGILRRWRPDIVHTLGLEPAAYVYSQVRKSASVASIGKWVAQVRGGPDLALYRLLPEYAPRIREVMVRCDRLIADNQQNYDYALDMGLQQTQVSELGVVPGTGGVDIEWLSTNWQDKPSQRRGIVWPKAYECPQSTALPVLEAIRLAWDRLASCEIHMLGTEVVQPTVRMWVQTLPADARAHCKMRNRISREETLRLMTSARVMLAPALADGVPNSLYEAMAAGAFPIVSPLDTIRQVVTEGRNVLFARNLYPTEIADALVRAMTDDVLVDEAATRNLEVVRRIANRTAIRERVLDFYEQLAAEAAPEVV